MRMKIRGCGSTELRGRRSCRVEFVVEDVATGEVRRMRKTFTVSARTRQERERCKREFRAEIEGASACGDRNLTFGEYAGRWLERRSADPALAAQTVRKDAYRLGHINQRFSRWRIAAITRTDVRDFQLALVAGGVAGEMPTASGRPLSGTTASGVRQTLRQVLQEAVRDGVIAANPCDDLPGPACDTRERSPLTPAEAARLRDALDAEGPTCLTVACRLCLFAGLRRGEACGLRWDDCDLEAGRVSVRRSLCDLTHEFREPKTRAGRRVVPLDGATTRFLREFRARQAPLIYAAGHTVGEACVVARPGHDYMRPKDLSRSVADFGERHGFGHVTPHLLRHTYCTLLVSAGVDLKTVQHLMGHADAATTLRVYAHYRDADGVRAAGAIGALMEGLGGVGGDDR